MAKGRSTWGSIRKRGIESWEIRYPVGPKTRSETIRGTRSDAELRLAELRVEYDIDSDNMTLDYFWVIYYAPESQDRLALSTWHEYKRYYQRDIKPVFGESYLKDIRPRSVQRWLDDMTNGKAKACKRVLSAILSRAYALDFIDDNPAQRRFVYPKAKAKGQRSKDVYSFEELREIYELSKGEIWRAAFILAGFGGAQLGEAMSVKLDEIYEIDEFAIVPIVRSVQRIEGKVQVLPHPKNKYRERELVIPPPFSQGLMQLVDEGIKSGDVWLSDDGFQSPLSPTIITRRYGEWFKAQTIRYVPFSNLRNSYGTVLEVLGMDGLMASKMMGHSQPMTYYRHYLRPKVSDKIDALKELPIDSL